MTNILKHNSISRPVTAMVAIAAVVALVVPAVLAHASGPAFNIFPIGYTGATNQDYPLLDGRNVSDNGQFSLSASDHDNGVSADPGETVELIIYYHNGAADAPENIAQNMRVRATLPSGTATVHTVSAQISADNAGTVTSSQKGGNMDVHINGNAQRLEYVSGSTRWYPEGSSSGQQMPDGIVSSGITIGDIRGCWDFAGFVKFRVRVTQDLVEEDGYLQIDKNVSNITSDTSFRDQVDADPSDTVEFEIIVRATSGDVREVVIRDILPSELYYVSGTFRVNGSNRSNASDLFGSGYEYGTLYEGQSATIRFEADVASYSYFGTSARTLTNTANARGRNVSTVQDTALVRISGQVQSSSFTLSKAAYNQTQGVNAQSVYANEGDVINYTLTYRNTGNTSITNVVIEDDLSDVLRHADIINTGDGAMYGNTIRFPTITVPSGVSIDETFQVRVRSIGGSDLVMSNIYGNQIDIQLRPPTVKGTYIAPKSGPAENFALFGALLVTAALYIRRKYPSIAARMK